MTNTIADITQDAQVLVLVGTNPEEAHPVLGMQIRAAVERGTRLVVVDPRDIGLSKLADVHLKLRPGTNVAFANGMAHVIVRDGLFDRAFVEERTDREGFEALCATVAPYTPERVAEICRIDARDLVAAAHLYAEADRAAILYCLGVTEHATGTDGVMALSNLAMMCGKIGRAGCGVNPIRGQNNVQGACDMGAMPTDFTGYQKVADPRGGEVRARLGRRAQPQGRASRPPSASRPWRAARCAGCSSSARTPCAPTPTPTTCSTRSSRSTSWWWRTSSSPRRPSTPTWCCPAAATPRRRARSPTPSGGCSACARRWRVPRARAWTPRSSPSSCAVWVTRSPTSRRPSSWTRWPRSRPRSAASATSGSTVPRSAGAACSGPAPRPTTRARPSCTWGRGSRGVGQYSLGEYRPSAEQPDDAYPLVLSTGRVLSQYNACAMTGRTPGLNEIDGSSFIEINTADADALGIADGDRVRVSSRRGSVETRARVSGKTSPGETWMPLHFQDGNCNWLTIAALDEVAKVPEYKVCAVRVEKA